MQMSSDKDKKTKTLSALQIIADETSDRVAELKMVHEGDNEQVYIA